MNLQGCHTTEYNGKWEGAFLGPLAAISHYLTKGQDHSHRYLSCFIGLHLPMYATSSSTVYYSCCKLFVLMSKSCKCIPGITCTLPASLEEKKRDAVELEEKIHLHTYTSSGTGVKCTGKKRNLYFILKLVSKATGVAVGRPWGGGTIVRQPQACAFQLTEWCTKAVYCCPRPSIWTWTPQFDKRKTMMCCSSKRDC